MNQQNIRIVTMAGICMLALAGCGSTYAAGKAQNPPAATIEEAASASVTVPEALVPETTPAEQATVQESVPAPVAEDTVAQTEIGVEKAKEIALNHAGLSASEVGFIKAHMDYDDGRQVYDVEFYKDMTEYDYEIDAFTGDIWSYDFDIEGYAIPQPAPAAPAQAQAPAAPAAPTQQQAPVAPAPPAPQAPAQPAAPAQSAGQISLEQAKQIATNHAGVSGVTFIKAYQDFDDGRLTYEVDFVAGTTEYDYEIDAATGAILEFDAESIYDD